MVKLSKRFVISSLILILLTQGSIGLAQTFTIDPADGKIDTAWNSVGASVVNDYREDQNATDVDRTGDIINAWLVYELSDPYNIYFRIDGFDLTDGLSVQFDCDGDGRFASKEDRAIEFVDESNSDEGGPIVGYIDYTEDYYFESEEEVESLPDSLDNPLEAKGEFVLEDEETNFLQIEAVLTFTVAGNSSQDLNEKAPSSDVFREMEPCFGMRDGKNANWTVNYQYFGLDDDTGTPFSKDVRTAVTLSELSTRLPALDRLSTLLFMFLLVLTVSLLYVHSQRRTKNV